MFSDLTIKLALIEAVIVAFSTWLYGWHDAPLDESEERRLTIIKKDRNISTLQNDLEVKPFESRFKAIKESITSLEENKHEEVNLTIGIHTTVFD